jgi:hypothetical protein
MTTVIDMTAPSPSVGSGFGVGAGVEIDAASLRQAMIVSPFHDRRPKTR